MWVAMTGSVAVVAQHGVDSHSHVMGTGLGDGDGGTGVGRGG